MGVTWVVCGGTRPPLFERNEKEIWAQIRNRARKLYASEDWDNTQGRKSTWGRVRNLRKWEMNHLWLPCFKNNRLSMTYRKHERRNSQYLKRGNSWGCKWKYIPSLCAGQKTTHMSLLSRIRWMEQCQHEVWTPLIRLVCVKSVYDFLVPQQLQDYITTTQPTTQVVSAQKGHKERQDQGNGVKSSVFKASGRIIGLGWSFGQ
jgi:hypothetical protein